MGLRTITKYYLPDSRGLKGNPSMKGLLLAIAAICGAVLHGQTASVVRSGSYEIGGFAGASYGIDKFRWMGGGNLTYALTKRILPYAEYSYFPGIPRTRREFRGADLLSADYNVPLHDFHGGVHIRFPIREFPIVPYGVFGMGVIHAPQTEVTNVRFAGAPFLPYTAPATTDFAVNGGGGLRYYISQRFGIRTEAKVYKPTGNFSRAFGKVEFGFFLQLR
jgi:hypothetical protein